jgi:hypothetical protein
MKPGRAFIVVFTFCNIARKPLAEANAGEAGSGGERGAVGHEPPRDVFEKSALTRVI